MSSYQNVRFAVFPIEIYPNKVIITMTSSCQNTGFAFFLTPPPPHLSTSTPSPLFITLLPTMLLGCGLEEWFAYIQYSESNTHYCSIVPDASSDEDRTISLRSSPTDQDRHVGTHCNPFYMSSPISEQMFWSYSYLMSSFPHQGHCCHHSIFFCFLFLRRGIWLIPSRCPLLHVSIHLSIPA